MDLLMQTLRALLVRCIEDIDSGKCSLNHEELGEAINALKNYSRKDTPMSKYQAFTYLNISRATFDNYIRDGKLPVGQKVQGFTEKCWFQKDLDRFIKACHQKK